MGRHRTHGRSIGDRENANKEMMKKDRENGREKEEEEEERGW